MRHLEQRARTTEEDVSVLRRFLEQFRSIQILFGQLVEVPMLVGEVRGFAYHSLKRPYKGAFVVNSSAGGLADAVQVMAPKTVQFFEYADPSKQVVITTGDVLNEDTNFLLWVF